MKHFALHTQFRLSLDALPLKPIPFQLTSLELSLHRTAYPQGLLSDLLTASKSTLRSIDITSLSLTPHASPSTNPTTLSSTPLDSQAKLFEGMKKLEKLRSLKVDLEKLNPSNDEAYGITNSITSYRTLTTLNLRFPINGLEILSRILDGILDDALEISILTLDFSTRRDEYPTSILADIYSQSVVVSTESTAPSSWEGVIFGFVERSKGLRRLRLVSTRIENGRWEGVRRCCEARGVEISGFE